MDTASPELGSGAEPADRAVWGTSGPLPVKDNEIAGTPYPIKRAFQPYASDISSITGNAQPRSADRVWAAPTYSFFTANVRLVCKKFKDHV